MNDKIKRGMWVEYDNGVANYYTPGATSYVTAKVIEIYRDGSVLIEEDGETCVIDLEYLTPVEYMARRT